MKFFGLKSEKDVGFERVPNSEDCEGLLPDSERSSLDSRTVRTIAQGPSWPITVAIAVTTTVISLLIGIWLGQTYVLDADNFTINHSSQWSSVVGDVGIKYSKQRFNGSLMKSNVFRQDFGPEVDAAWKSLGADFHAVRIPTDQAARSNLAPDQVKIKEKYGGGYPANIEGLHHLHCLNLLRKSLAWNFNHYAKEGLGPFSNDKTVLKFHVTHCLDILRQQLMCNVDVGVLGQVWYEPEGKPLQGFVDFNTVHTCRNFEAIRNWAEKHQLPLNKDLPPDFLELPKAGDRIYHETP
ncbi:hypothetical protein B0J11DRAFT_541974 [Dendryphion nanum]|uniref:Tat pathway signal sequence n=1 Tax=Dendryphion nanum TaxID=256645 RepID=A0A9P9D5K8_9PLEO|nr:hypothetical protein B0J11DRAFT_541974 [Dendryphion nanum]